MADPAIGGLVTGGGASPSASVSTTTSATSRRCSRPLASPTSAPSCNIRCWTPRWWRRPKFPRTLSGHMVQPGSGRPAEMGFGSRMIVHREEQGPTSPPTTDVKAFTCAARSARRVMSLPAAPCCGLHRSCRRICSRHRLQSRCITWGKGRVTMSTRDMNPYRDALKLASGVWL